MHTSELRQVKSKIHNLSRLIKILNNDIKSLQMQLNPLQKKKLEINHALSKLRKETDDEMQFYSNSSHLEFDFASFYKFQKHKEEVHLINLHKVQNAISKVQDEMQKALINKKQYEILIDKAENLLIQHAQNKEMQQLDEFSSRMEIA